MFYATKGAIQLQVQLNDELTIIPMVSSGKFADAARVIADSHKAIIVDELKHIPAHEKMETVKHYFRLNGWDVHN